MLKNFWYGLLPGRAVTAQPKKLRLVDRTLVLYRGSDGRAVVMDDVCAHRGTALSGGWVEGNCLRCPYHGWRYAPDGECTLIPASPPQATIPARARVRSYRVEERYGLVWAYLGDPSADLPVDTRSLPPLPQYDDPLWRTTSGSFTWGGHYTRVIANTVDMAHASFVHASAFGRRDSPRIHDYDLVLEGERGSASIHFKTRPAHFLKLVLGSNPPDGSITSTFHLPNTTQVHHRFGRIEFILFLVHVPVDERTTVSHWLHLRNFVRFPWADPLMGRDVVRTLLQDNQVVCTQPPGPVPALAAEPHAPSDRLEIAYRKLRERILREPQPPIPPTNEPQTRKNAF